MSLSNKAADNITPKLDLAAELAKDPKLAAKIYQDAQPDSITKPQGPAPKDATSPTGSIPDVTNPFSPAFNELGPKDKAKTPGTAPKADTILTDPFNPVFNVPGKTGKPGDVAPKPDVKLTDPFSPLFNVPGKPGDAPNPIVNPFDPKFIELPKGGKDVPPPKVPDSKLPQDLNVDPFDPFKDWNSVPGLKPMVPKPAPKDAPVVKPGGELPKPADPTVKPVEPLKPGGEVPKPSDKVEPKPSDKIVPNPVFNETNVGEAVKLAAAKNQPIIVISTPDGKVGATEAAAMQAKASEAVFVNVNFQHADQMMRAGLEDTHYWQLANLCGAAGDVNNLYQKPGFIGRFNATDFNAQNPRGSLKAVAANDAEKVFGPTVKPPAPGPIAPAPVKTDGKVEPIKPPAVPPTDSKVVPPKVAPGPVKPDGKVEPVTPPAVPKTDSTVVPPKDTKVVPQDTKIDPPKDAPAQPSSKGPVKLDKADFTTAEADKAVKYALDNKLPLIVYKGAASCGNCPTTRANMVEFGKEIEGKPTTEAVVLRLDWDTLQKLEKDNPAAAKVMKELVPPGTGFPNVAVYNPNDLSKPLADVYGSDISSIRGLVKTGQDSIIGDSKRPGPGTTNSGAAASTPIFNERNILSATKAANEKNIPLISYVDGQANPKMTKALQYLQDSGLASTVSISAPKAEQMLSTGLESKHFYALKNAMTPAPGTTNGAHLSSFAPANLRPGQQFAPARSADAKASADQIVSFLKQSGVDLSKNNSEAAVRALLDGGPVPPAPKAEEKKPDAAPEVKTPATPVRPEAKKPDVPEVKKPVPLRPEEDLTLLLNPVTPKQPEVKVPPAVADKPATPPVPEVKKPDATPTVPEVKIPPALPQLDKPAAPPVPEVKKPDATPTVPEVKIPPALPQLDKPTAPSVPEVKKPDATPTVPEVKIPPALPQLDKPAAPPVPEVKKPEEIKEKPPAALPTTEKTLPKPPALDEIVPVKAEEKLEANNQFKAKTAEDALKIIADAKKRNLPLVVHSMTVICTDQQCVPNYLPKGLPEQFANKALFLELPRSGVKIPDGAQYDELRAINELYKTTPEDHKTQLDLHVFKLNGTKYELNDGDSPRNVAGSAAGNFIRARLEAASKDSKKP